MLKSNVTFMKAAPAFAPPAGTNFTPPKEPFQVNDPRLFGQLVGPNTAVGPAQSAGRERPVKSKKKLLLMHSAIGDGGSGFQPRFTRSDKHF